MYFSKTSRSRSICINGDWDNVIYEMTIQDGESLTKAEEAINEKLNEWENEVRKIRTSEPVKVSTKGNKETEIAEAIADVIKCKTLAQLLENEKYVMSQKDKTLTDTYNTMLKKLSK